MTSFPILQTSRLVLREFKPEDVEALYDIFSQDIVTRYYNLETMHSLDQSMKLVDVRISHFKKGIGIRWAIALKGNADLLIGSCGCYNLNKVYRSMEIGYDLHPSFWRQGLMTEALTNMLGVCFSNQFFFYLNRVEALTDVDNIASIGLLSKLGFKQEGIRREYGFWKGNFHDARSFALLRQDWQRKMD